MYQTETKNNIKPITIILGLLLVALAIIALMLLFNKDDDSKLNSQVLDSTESNKANNTTDSQPVADIDLGQTEGIKIGVKNYRYKAIGTVPDQKSLEVINKVIGLNFGDSGVNEITIDPEASPKPWLANTQNLLSSVNNLTLDGTVEVTDDKTIITAIVPNATYDAQLKRTLTTEAGFPEVEFNTEIKNLVPAEVIIKDDNGTVNITSVMPSEAMKTKIEEASKQIWGDKITSLNVTVDENRFASMNWNRYAVLVGGLPAFTNYEAGSKDGTPYGIFTQGLNFDTNSTQLTPDSAKRLLGITPIMLSTANAILIEGHTDNVGSDQTNKELSQARAETVAKTIQQGTNGLIDPKRFVTSGLGESDPVASNDTEEGKAQNRRVKISIIDPAKL